MKILKYRIVSNRRASEVESKINELLKKGWVPFGSLAYSYDNREGCLVYAQPITLIEDEN